MADRDVASEVLKGLREIHEHRAGKVTLRTTQVEARPLPELTSDAIRRIRASLDVSRSVFAHMIRIPVRTVEGWERGKSRPPDSARALILMAEKYPDTFDRLASL